MHLVSFFLLFLVLLDVDQNLLHHGLVELLSVAEEKHHFKEHKERSGKERLVKAVKERGGSFLEDAVADELENPTGEVNRQCNFPDWNS